jgi:hypothetical protein
MNKERFVAFYSWQSDLRRETNHSFIESSLRAALDEIGSPVFDLEPVLDRDTRGTDGSPDIVSTIFAKIDRAQLFVADVSIVTSEGRPCPNPNVLIELGYAARSLSWDRVVLVCNQAYGAVEDLPFDLRQRRTLTYDLPKGAGDRVRKAAAKKLREAFAACLTSAAQAVQRELLTPKHTLKRDLLDELRRRVTSLLAFMVQAAEPSLTGQQKQAIDACIASAPRGEVHDSSALATLVDAFNNVDNQLRHSGLAVDSERGRIKLTWMAWMIGRLNSVSEWCAQTLANYGGSERLDEELILSIVKLRRTSELLARQLTVFDDPQNLPFHHENLRATVSDLLNQLMHALLIAA